MSARRAPVPIPDRPATDARSEEHTSELQSQSNLVCRPLLEKKNRLESPLGMQQHAACQNTRFTPLTPPLQPIRWLPNCTEPLHKRSPLSRPLLSAPTQTTRP